MRVCDIARPLVDALVEFITLARHLILIHRESFNH